MKKSVGTSSGSCTCNFICTYDSAKDSIAWYNIEDKKLKLVGYGSSAPDSPLGYDQSDEQWSVSGVTVTDKEEAVSS